MTQEYEYLLQRKQESVYDLYETVASKQKIVLAKFIDSFIFFGLMLATLHYFGARHIDEWYWVLFFVALAFIIIWFTAKAVLRGNTLGHVLMKVRFINVKSKQPLTPKEFLDYLFLNIKFDELNYDRILNYYFKLSDKSLQNIPMKRSRIIVVDLVKYKKFLHEYYSNLRRLEELEDSMEEMKKSN